MLPIQQTQTRVIACAVLLTTAMSAAHAQDDPTRQWVYCFGPQHAGRMPAPSTLYVSGVSTIVRPSDQTHALITAAFREFVREKYGADFEPRCDYVSSESAAEGWVKYFASPQNGGARVAKVKTDWVWTQPASDMAPTETPLPKQRPGALEH